ncbi:hypothetical protein WJX72_009315 [[Myrmecia] bisecta]|uniref:Thioredoxin domain-containing protein n=1 Tax=[Myrmecia] bisecta TaxID=41462 RepID=A0AAW1PZ33_9CHLO
MIDIFAPWCPHCRDLEKTWAALATELKGSIHIGKIDGTKEKALMQRFDVEAFPTIYHLRTGETRQYDGKRTLPALLEFARGGWQEVKPLPFYQAPNSLYGRISGRLLGLPNQAKEYYIYLHQEKHYSQLVLLASFLAVPITIGMGLICALDAYYSRQPHPWTPPVARAHHD